MVRFDCWAGCQSLDCCIFKTLYTAFLLNLPLSTKVCSDVLSQKGGSGHAALACRWQRSRISQDTDRKETHQTTLTRQQRPMEGFGILLPSSADLDAIFCIERWNIGAASIGHQGGCAIVRHAQSTRAEEHNWRNLHNKRKSPEVGLETYPW